MYQGKSYLVHGKTITETQKLITELKYKLEHGIYVTKEKITLDEWFTTWLEEYKKNRVKLGTYTNYEKYYKSIIKNRLGSRQLSEIRGEHIQKLYNELVKEGYALSSIKIVSAVLNGYMKDVIGIHLKPEVFPMSDLAGWYNPLFLNRQKAFVVENIK